MPGCTPTQWDVTKDAQRKHFLQLISMLLGERPASKLGPTWKSDRTAWVWGFVFFKVTIHQTAPAWHRRQVFNSHQSFNRGKKKPTILTAFLCSLAQPTGSIQHLQSPPAPAEHTGAFSLGSHRTSSPQPAEEEGTASTPSTALTSSKVSGCSLMFAPSDAVGRWEGKLQRVPICKALTSSALQNRAPFLPPPPPQLCKAQHIRTGSQ